MKNHANCFEFQPPREPDDVFPVLLSDDSWTLKTAESPHQAPLPDDAENENGGEGHDEERASGILNSF